MRKKTCGLRLTAISEAAATGWNYDGECMLLNPGEYLMEIKVNGAYPLWLADLLGKLEIYPTSFSKYGAVYAQAMQNQAEMEEKQICLQVY